MECDCPHMVTVACGVTCSALPQKGNGRRSCTQDDQADYVAHHQPVEYGDSGGSELGRPFPNEREEEGVMNSGCSMVAGERVLETRGFIPVGEIDLNDLFPGVGSGVV